MNAPNTAQSALSDVGHPPEFGMSMSNAYDPQAGPSDRHPILRDAVILPTRPLEEFVNMLRLWLDNLLPGGVVWGSPRMGKTQAIRYVMANAEALLGAPIPVSLHSSWDPTHSSLSENRFYAALLKAMDYSMSQNGTASVKRQRTVDFMIDRARHANEHRYLLFIDEVQWLANVQLSYLTDLHNQLKIADIRLITVLVGQPELLERKAALRSNGHNQLLGRFMTGTHEYEGVTDRADFARVCRAIDIQSEYPQGSGVSFTRYFVPNAFEQGWRLEPHSDMIWERLEQIQRDEGVPQVDELPMQALTALLRWILQTLAENDGPELSLGRAMIDEAIYRVALLQILDHAQCTGSSIGKREKRCPRRR